MPFTPQISVRIKQNDLGRLKAAAPAKASKALDALAIEGVNYAKMLIQTSPPSGREYPRGEHTHIASSPGEAPRSDIGTLINSIHVEQPSAMSRQIVDGVEYGIYDEFGTADMEARPFMTPTAVYVQGQVTPIFNHFLD